MYETGLSATFHASHRLVGNFGPAGELHSHDYRVDVAVFGEELTDEGILVDIVALEEALSSVVKRWDHQRLDTLPELAGINTTMESVAAYLHRQISEVLRENGNLTLEVKLWESPTAWGSLRERVHDKAPDASS